MIRSCRSRSNCSVRREALMAAGKLEQAEDALETALAVDPRNRGAFVDIARVAEKQHLFGKAIRMTSKALAARAERSGRDRRPGRSDGRARRDRRAPRRTCRSCRRFAAPRAARRSPSFPPRSARGPTVASAKAPGKPEDRTSVSARASAIHSSTLSVSARRCGVDAECFRGLERAGHAPSGSTEASCGADRRPPRSAAP